MDKQTRHSMCLCWQNSMLVRAAPAQMLVSHPFPKTLTPSWCVQNLDCSLSTNGNGACMERAYKDKGTCSPGNE
eukprot:1156480-Pelagomonas_calceolata.AAC.7